MRLKVFLCCFREHDKKTAVNLNNMICIGWHLPEKTSNLIFFITARRQLFTNTELQPALAWAHILEFSKAEKYEGNLSRHVT